MTTEKFNTNALKTTEKKMQLALALTSVDMARQEHIVQGLTDLKEDLTIETGRSFVGYILKGPFDIASSMIRSTLSHRAIDRKYNVKKNSALVKQSGFGSLL